MKQVRVTLATQDQRANWRHCNSFSACRLAQRATPPDRRSPPPPPPAQASGGCGAY